MALDPQEKSPHQQEQPLVLAAHTTDKAWRKYPHAQDTLSACDALELEDRYDAAYQNGIKTASMFSKVFDAYAASPLQIRQLAAAIVWDNLPDARKYGIPFSLRQTFADLVDGSDQGTRVKTNIYETTTGLGGDDPAFASWQSRKNAELLERLRKDPLIAEAEQKWGNVEYGVIEKLKLAERIHEIHADVYGFEKAEILPYVGQPETVGDTAHPNSTKTEVITGAYYDHTDNRMNINLYKDKKGGASAPIHGDFADFASLVVHEGTHTFQAQLSDRYNTVNLIESIVLLDMGAPNSHLDLSDEGRKIYESEMQRHIAESMEDPENPWNKELYGDGALKDHAAYMHSNYFQHYMSSDQHGFSAYQSNPVEQYSRHTEDEVHGYFSTAPSGRDLYLHSIKEWATNYGESEEKRLAERDQALKKPEACLP
ncbi:MAG: hypothetical protein ACK4NR_09855 [Micavibrio sp.]